MNKMTISIHCFHLIEEFECSGNLSNYLAAYKAPEGQWTIGMGNTYYANGDRVKEGDILTLKQASDLFMEVIPVYEKIVNTYILKPLKQWQFDALVSFVYNVPKDAFTKSTLRRMINDNPDDSNIADEWLKWVYFTNPQGKKVMSNGLLNRRKAEVDMYFNR